MEECSVKTAALFKSEKATGRYNKAVPIGKTFNIDKNEAVRYYYFYR